MAQVPHRHEPDSAGEINFQYIFQLLSEANYNGWIGLEYIPLSSTTNGLKWVEKYGVTF